MDRYKILLAPVLILIALPVIVYAQQSPGFPRGVPKPDYLRGATPATDVAVYSAHAAWCPCDDRKMQKTGVIFMNNIAVVLSVNKGIKKSIGGRISATFFDAGKGRTQAVTKRVVVPTGGETEVQIVKTPLLVRQTDGITVKFTPNRRADDANAANNVSWVRKCVPHVYK